ncbi:MAG TPA: hypothetical protein VNU26_04450, partial [Mycobacteriales bacterium]|nr:hypothetical protein [Mycobacteriales bacterium]
MAQGSTQVSGEPRGESPTREGERSTGSGLDAAVAGATVLLTLYGLLAILLDLFFHAELVPDSSVAPATAASSPDPVLRSPSRVGDSPLGSPLTWVLP